MAILTSDLRTANCRAAIDVTALKIDREDFRELMVEKPELALGVIKVLADSLIEIRQKVSIIEAGEGATSPSQD